ncbi:hypothetical protein [Candidatus Odyssella acanthamoebae]|uniref:DUF1871 domain-containing protein n=1 Tax=Candidatus Odyssella acanthamoebae TaxID=91604 RepID=A0A077AZP4_9PROT|nr:hypothetical protein [Candidatus Paracaedibacter acanthamoebae]AIK96200.1 hypothetical protein ID47_04730 [Candidatus Paracaedibacter acanthamoebae]
MSVQISDKVKNINELLFKEWDPIGISELGAGNDEYLSYALQIDQLLLEGINEDNLAKFLDSCEEYMLLPPRSKENQQIAKRILHL